MLSKKIKRKSRRQGIKLLKVSGIFGVVFILTIAILFLGTARKSNGIVSPLAKLKIYSQTSSMMDKSEVERLLRRNKVVYKEVIVRDRSYLVKMSPSGEVILSPDKDMHQQISSLQVILTRLTMEGKAIVKLDMRYDKPVIVLK